MRTNCAYCGNEFEANVGNYNRSIKGGKKLYCSIHHSKLALATNLTGRRFGRLLVLSMVEICKEEVSSSVKNRIHWKCICDCGKERIVCGKYLLRGYSKSCGCKTKEKRYGQTKYREYSNWNAMMQRCYNHKSTKYYMYGAKGIVVCDRWKTSFKLFLKDMGKKPTPKHTLDRYPDMDGNYEPLNCRWATPKEQARNRARVLHWIEYNGKRMILQDWADLFKVDSSSLCGMMVRCKSFERIYKYYMIDKSNKLIYFNGKSMNKAEWARFFKVSPSTLSERIRNGQPFSEIYSFYKNKNNGI
jgi:hypothetical protein